jgi:hypothetical protein
VPLWIHSSAGFVLVVHIHEYALEGRISGLIYRQLEHKCLERPTARASVNVVDNPVPSIAELKKKPMLDQLTSVLLHNKASLLEGMVFESVLDRKLFRHAPSEIQCIPCHAIATTPLREGGRYCVFVWFITPTVHGALLKQNLSTRYEVHEVFFDETNLEFVVSLQSGALEPLEQFLQRETGRQPLIEARAENQEDTGRKLNSVFGYLGLPQMGDPFREAILPRVLKDFRIEPYFQGCWDLDRFFALDGSIWTVEVKHKYPSSEGFFSLNKGQAYQAKSLISCGIRYVHLIFVKPFWEKGHSSIEYLVNQDLAPHIAIIGSVFSRQSITALCNSPDWMAPPETSLTGKAPQPCKRLFLNHFYRAGRYDEDPEVRIWPRIMRLLKNGRLSTPCVTYESLDKLRLDQYVKNQTRPASRKL